METYYINLDKRPDKNALFLELNEGVLPFQRYSAAEGSLYNHQLLVEYGLISTELDSYSQGALGCALSHKLLWEYAAKLSEPLTVLEDDAVLNHEFTRHREDILKNLPQDWDIILWGWNFDSILHVHLPGKSDSFSCFQRTLTEIQIHEFRQSSFVPTVLKLHGAFGTVGYTISPNGAKRLMQCCFPLQKESVMIPGLNRQMMNIGIDVAMNKWYPYLQAYAAFPPLVVTRNDKTISDVS